MKIAILQTAPKKDAPAENLERALGSLAKATDEGAQLAVLPECAISGYAIPSVQDARRLAEPLPGPTTLALQKHCLRTGSYVACGLLERDGDDLYNAAVLVGPDGIIGRHRKAHIVPIGADAFVKQGTSLDTFEIAGVKIGMMICYEVRFPEIARVMALKGAQVLVVVANWPAGADVNPRIMIPARAAENHVHVLAANRAGAEGALSFIGKSSIHAPNGSCISLAGEREEMLLADIEVGSGLGRLDVTDSRYVVDLRGHRRPELYREVTK